MTIHDRLATALDLIASATGVQRARAYDATRSTRNGDQTRDGRMEAVVVSLEAAAAEMWLVLNEEEERELRAA